MANGREATWQRPPVAAQGSLVLGCSLPRGQLFHCTTNHLSFAVKDSQGFGPPTGIAVAQYLVHVWGVIPGHK